MDSVTNGVNDRFHGGAEHARHDRLLVSRYGAGDAYGTEIAEAEQLVKRCSHCAQLARDINTLRAATAELPTPRRTRDFRLTETKAESLHGSALQRWFRRLAAPGLAPLRPLAGAAVSVGLVLVVAGVALPTPAGQMFTAQDNQAPGGALAPDNRDTSNPLATPAAPAEIDGQPAPTMVSIERGYEEVGLGDDIAAADATRSLLVYSGLLIAVVSMALLLVLVIARRRGTDSLLR
jgi:hypothetical protein